MQSNQTKVALVTGASQGLGEGIVHGYVKAGYKVIASSRSIKPDKFESPTVVAVPGDISKPETAENLVRTAIERFGRIDSLVNNAGIYIAKPFVDYTEEDFAALIATNCAGFLHITQRAIRQMLKQGGGGSVVNITATIADQPMKEALASVQCLTKGGLNSVTRALAIEYADAGIRVNAVAPGLIKTPLIPGPHDKLGHLQPMGRMGEIEDVVEAVMYFDSAKFVTGEIIHIDGGQHAGHW
jgi:NAD(P)-dependent dehydrogenase (short-subunit alcohol dehydrogenase family)